MLRLTLVGCGAHSEAAHARALAHYVARHPGEVELAAACDLDGERAGRFCQAYGFARAYVGLEEMLRAEEPDAVVSVLPIDRIGEAGGELLRRNIPCVLEKPPGRSLAEAEALAEVARQTGTPHMVSLNRRFSPYLGRAVAWARSAGPIRYVRAQMLRRGRDEADFLWGTGIHIVDAVCQIGGQVDSFEVRRLGHVGTAASWFLISVRFASGCVGHIEILPTSGTVEERYELFGDGYRACAVTMGEESVRCWTQGVVAEETIADAADPQFLRDGSYEETSAFIKSLRNGEFMRPCLDDVLPALRICAEL